MSVPGLAQGGEERGGEGRPQSGLCRERKLTLGCSVLPREGSGGRRMCLWIPQSTGDNTD